MMLHHQARAGIRAMRQRARRTILDTGIGIGEIPTTTRSERIERTVAKQAIELVRGNALVTGKVLTRLVREERILICRLVVHASQSTRRKSSEHICLRRRAWHAVSKVSQFIPFNRDLRQRAGHAPPLVRLKRPRPRLPCHFDRSGRQAAEWRNLPRVLE